MDWTTYFLEPIYAVVDLALDRPLAMLVLSSALGVLVAATVFAAN